MMRVLSGLAILVVAGVAALLLWLRGPDVSVACDAGGRGLPTDAPPALVAIFDRDCAAALDPQLALDLGYPSLAKGTLPEAEWSDLVIATLGEGDRGFYSADLGMIEAAPDEVADVIRARLSPETALENARDPATVLGTLMLWPKGAGVMLKGCDGVDCAADTTVCPGPVGLAEKQAVAEGSMTLADLQGMCPPEVPWILALRRAGVVDTSCTSTWAVNRALMNPATLGEPCYPDGIIDDLPAAITPTDLVRIIRARGPEALPRLTPQASAALATVDPDLAIYLAKGE